jgi:hypothetical protein
MTAFQGVAQAQDAPASAIGAGAALPPAIEDGAIPCYDLGKRCNALVVLVPCSAPATAAAE